jgi:adenosylcobinamide-phosphate guanylyltransferase
MKIGRDKVEAGVAANNNINMTICVLMCGGIGSRIKRSSNVSKNRIEKPLILLNNKPLIEHIIVTILNAEKQFKIFAAVSSNTKETERFIKHKYSNKIIILKTQGRGYSEDFTNIIRYFKKESYIKEKEKEKQYNRNNLLLKGQEPWNKIEYSKILFLPIDLPLISTKTIERIVELKQETPLISIVIDKKVITENCFFPTPYIVKIDKKDYCYTGITVVNLTLFSNENSVGVQIEEEEPIIFNDPELAFNINTIDDLERTKEYFSKRIKNQKN